MRIASSLGIDTVFLTSNRSFYVDNENSPINLAGQIIDVDTYAVSAICMALAKKKPTGIIAFDDFHLEPASIVARKLGLAHIDLGALLTCRYKHRLRDALSRYPNAVKYMLIQDLKEIEVNKLTIQYPVIVKPTDDSGGVGVKLCHSDHELHDAVDVLKEEKVNIRGYQREKKFVVEEYLEGKEYSCEALFDFQRQEYVLLGLTRKLNAQVNNTFVEVGHIFPVNIEEFSVQPIILEWLNALPSPLPAAHIEFLVSKNGPRLIEINPRLPGGRITELVHRTIGVDMVRFYLDFHMNLQPNVPLHSPHPQTYGISFVSDNPICQAVPSISGIAKTIIETKRRLGEYKHQVSNYDRPALSIAFFPTENSISGIIELVEGEEVNVHSERAGKS